MIDTHCHLYVKEFDSDRQAMLDRARRAGVTDFFLPAIDSSYLEAMESMSGTPGCHLMAGLHPCSVKENNDRELKIIEDQLKTGNYAGIGETGLDLYWDRTWFKQQEGCLRIQAEWALEYDLPLILHTREAIPETIAIISSYKSRGLRGIFHCFGGSLDEAKRIIDMGFYLGIGGVITYKNSGLDAVIREVPLQSVVLETDAPYLAPVPHRGKRNESSFITMVASKIAEVKNLGLEEVDVITSGNAHNLFSRSFKN